MPCTLIKTNSPQSFAQTHRIDTLEHDAVVGGLPCVADRVHGAIELAFCFHATAATLALDRLHLVFLQKNSNSLLVLHIMMMIVVGVGGGWPIKIMCMLLKSIEVNPLAAHLTHDSKLFQSTNYYTLSGGCCCCCGGHPSIS